ncbi:MAG: sugar transferase [Myxococcota bacterium]|nr:sugar transferase [Myxococcota bacterium]
MDILLSIFFILCFSPIFVGVALLIGVGGFPIIFRQRRNGLNGTTFWMYKFRTMKVIEDGDKEFKQAAFIDERYTYIGRFLRKFSLDELPQFFNSLLGDMSIVGPRPHPLALDRDFTPRIERYMDRYLVPPGITGLAQVRGYRGETDTLQKMQDRVNADLEYVERRSTKLYIAILLQTIFGKFIS